MSAVTELLRATPTAPSRPWPRAELLGEEWQAMAAALAAPDAPELRALWADTARIYVLLQEGESFLFASVAVEAGQYPALSPARPGAAWFERAIADLWGHTATGARDLRPWLDHGRWPAAAPLSARPDPAGPQRVDTAEPPVFLPSEGEELHQIGLGPVHGGIAEPAHFRLTVQGETVVRLETRLGYTHKGTLGLMRGKSPRAAARFAARLSGESTVAHSAAFARAAEAAADTPAPPRAAALRAVMAEVERIAIHLADIASLLVAAGLVPLADRCGRHREALLRAAAAAFGHRLMMDCVVPGGVAADIAPRGDDALLHALAALEREQPAFVAACEGHASLLDRLVGTGRVTPDLAAALAPGGVVGRAAGRTADLRRVPGYAPYPALAFEVPVLAGGDADARLRLRLAEIVQSAALLRTLLADLPGGEIMLPLPPVSAEGLGWAEGPRGDIWHWLRLEGGQIAACFLRDPAWLHWPLLEAVAAGDTVADLPLSARSFNLSCSGVDL